MIITRDDTQDGTICFWQEGGGFKLEKWYTGEWEGDVCGERWIPNLCEFDIVTFKKLFPNTKLIRKGSKRKAVCSITPDDDSMIVMTREDNLFGYVGIWYLEDDSELVMDKKGWWMYDEWNFCRLQQYAPVFFKKVFLGMPLLRKGSKQRVSLTCEIL